MTGNKRQSPVDEKWAWIILLATMINLALHSIIYTTGIFNVMFLEVFDESRSVTAWCGALHSGLSNLIGVGASLLNAYWGPRRTIAFGAACICLGFASNFFAKTFIHVFIMYGIIVGFGCGFTIIPGLVVLGFYFDKHRNIAFGVANASLGFGNAALAPLLQYLLDEYGMNGAMLITSAICAHMFVVAALTRPFHQNSNPASDDVKVVDAVNDGDTTGLKFPEYKSSMNSLSSTKLCKEMYTNRSPISLVGSTVFYDITSSSRSVCFERGNITTAEKGAPPSRNLSQLLSYPFVAWCTGLVLILTAISCIYLHFPAYAVSMGTSKDNAALLVMVMGLGSMTVRLLLGFITNNSKTRTFIAYVGTGIMASILLFAGPYISTSYLGQMLFAGLFSVFANGYSGLMGPIAIDMIGLEIFNVAFGIATTLCGVGFIIGPPIAGALYDYTGSYYYTFILSGACYLVAELLMLSSLLFKGKR